MESGEWSLRTENGNALGSAIGRGAPHRLMARLETDGAPHS